MPSRDRETLSAPRARSRPVPAPKTAEIVALRIPGNDVTYPLSPERNRTTIGGSRRADVALDDPYASGIHCVLERRPRGQLLVRDRGSKNGTFLDGNRVELAEVRPGARLRIGGTTLVAVAGDRGDARQPPDRLVGRDPAYLRALEVASRAAASDCGVLVLGETGTGKELVARAIHDGSPRASGPFVAVNCGAIPGELVESELFGHQRGAFTGAAAARDGVFVEAHGGTLFLDELGELPRHQQPHLLRVLETGRVRPVGAGGEVPVDVRIVAATNRTSGLGTDASPLRPDLFHRIATVVVELPPLRARRGDIPLLAEALLGELEAIHGRRVIAPATMDVLARHDWPGNVRELRHALSRAAVLCDHELTLDALLPRGRAAEAPAPREFARPATPPPGPAESLPGGYEDALRAVMQDAYERCGSMRAAARALKMPKSTFADRAQKLGLRARGH